MQAVGLAAHESLRLHVLRHAGVVVVLLDVRDHRRPVPQLRHRVRHGALRPLIAAAVADQDDVLEAVHLEAVHHVREHGDERRRAQAQRAGAGHVARLRFNAAFRHELDDRCAQRVAQLARDRLAVRVEHVVVLARDEPGSVGLHPAGGNDHRGLARLERIADIHPRHFLEPHRLGRGQGIGRIGTVVRAGTALAATHAAAGRRSCRGGCSLRRAGDRDRRRHGRQQQPMRQWVYPGIHHGVPVSLQWMASTGVLSTPREIAAAASTSPEALRA